MSSKGKSVVITGANAGIGLATALDLAAAGYDVVGTVRSEEKAEGLRAAAAEKGLAVRTVVLDVADAADTERGFAEIAAMTGGGPWAVVNNAGFARPGAIEDVTDEQAREQFEVNTVAPMRIARLVLPAMRERGSGRIVNISSVAGRVSPPLLGWYAASKAALETLSDALRVEVEPFGVRVVLVEPGVMGTGIWESTEDLMPEPSTPAYAAAYARMTSVTAKAKGGPDPVWIARAVRLALANPVPLARYLVGVDAVGTLVADRLVPTTVTDALKGVASGLKKSPLSR